MTRMRQGRIRNTIMAIGLGAAMAFGAFFSANTALARNYRCLTRELPSSRVNASKRGTESFFYSYVNLGEKVRQVGINRGLLLKNQNKSDDDLGMLIGANLDRAASVDGGRSDASGWKRFTCASLKEAQESQPGGRMVPDEGKPEEKPEPAKKPEKPAGRLVGADTQKPEENSTDSAKPEKPSAGSAVEDKPLPDKLPKVEKPEPKDELEQVGNWIVVRKFLKNPPLNEGKRYSPGSALTMMRDNRVLIGSAFTRVLKREPDLAGKAIVQISTDRNGVPKTIRVSGKANAELAQMYAHIFGRTRWSGGAQTFQFPILQRAQ